MDASKMTDGKGGPDGACPTCEDPGLLLFYVAGSLNEEERVLVERSLESCPACRVAVSDNALLARAVRLASAQEAAARPPSELVALATASSEQIEAARLSDEDRKLVDILRNVEGVEGTDADTGLGWRAWLQRGWDSLFRGEAWGWLRSPAVAYLLLVALAYPAYRGLTMGAAGAPHVLDAPRTLDAGVRASGEAIVSMDDDGGVVLTVFVPVDERYRYRLEIRDREGDVRFVDDDVRSFDGVGTIALFLPRGFLDEGSYEVRVIELEGTDPGNEIQVFRYPFRID